MTATHRAYLTDGPSREHHVFVGPKGVSASPGVKVKGVCRAPAAQPTREPMRDAGGPAKRVLICVYEGTAFSAERREDGSLAVYHVSADPLATSIGDGDNRMSLSRFQAAIEQTRKARGW